MSSLIRNTIFFIGWILSPLTFWNDAFVNIPLSYLAANIFIKIFPSDFLITVVVFYWLSNVAGLFIMYASGKYMITSRKDVIRELVILIATMAVYTAILMWLSRVGFLKPL